MAKPLEALLSDDDALWLVQSWTSESPHAVEVLPATRQRGAKSLTALQVTTRSPLGAIVFHTGGLLIDSGWLRVLGAGCERLPRAIDEWNGLPDRRRLEDGLIVADDAIGGTFGWFQDGVRYFGPDTGAWEALGLGYSEWLASMLSERLDAFYADLRWDGWREEVAAMPTTHGMHVMPPLMFKGPSLAKRSRRAVPMGELLTLGIDVRAAGHLR